MAPNRHFSRLFSNRGKAESQNAAAIPKREPVDIIIRDPIPLDPARPSLAQLPDLVLRRIFTLLHESRPEHILTVASLTSSLYQQARYVQHRHVHIDLDKSRHVLDRLDLIKRLSQSSAIRKLKVTSRNYEEGQEKNNEILGHLAAMLPAMTGLRHLDWDVGSVPTGPYGAEGSTALPIPASILEALSTDLQLHTSIFCNPTIGSHEQARSFLHRLEGNRNLHTLSIKVIFRENEEYICLKTMQALKKVLLSSPNLTRLPGVEVWYPRGGCWADGPPISGLYCGLGLLEGEKLPVFEELGMDSYPWGIPGAPQCQGYHGNLYEWDEWARILDWSRLGRLNHMTYPLQDAIAPKLTSLRELVTDREAEFLANVTSPLELLGIPSWDSVTGKPEVITSFGTTLRELRIHQIEQPWDREVSMVAASDLVYLSKSLLHLETIALDMPRAKDSQDWPYEAMDAIAAFPSLRTAELWFPLGNRPPAPTPILTASSARRLFYYLRERNERIQFVVLHSGSPYLGPPSRLERSMRAGLGPRWSWDRHSYMTFECSMVYDGENSEQEGWLRVSCPQLSTEMNEELHRLAEQTDPELPSPIELDEKGLRLWVALNGPLDKAQWDAWDNEQWMRYMCDQKERKRQSKPLHRLIVGPMKRVWKR